MEVEQKLISAVEYLKILSDMRFTKAGVDIDKRIDTVCDLIESLLQ